MFVFVVRTIYIKIENVSILLCNSRYFLIYSYFQFPGIFGDLPKKICSRHELLLYIDRVSEKTHFVNVLFSGSFNKSFG